MAVTSFWKLNDNAASTTVVATTGSNAALEGGDNTSAKYTTDTPGGQIFASFDLNGTDDAVNVGTVSLGAGVAWSVSAWVKCDTSGAATILGRGTGATAWIVATGTTLSVRLNSVSRSFTITSLGTGWNHVLVTHTTGNDVKVYINGTPSNSNPINVSTDTGTLGYIGRSTTAYHDGHIAYVKIFDSDESANAATLYAEGTANSITIDSPVAHRVFQHTNGTADISITGSYGYTGTAPAIYAQLGDNAPQQIVASPSGGMFSGTLTNQPLHRTKQTLEVYFNGFPEINSTVANVGVGNIVVMAGQSNCSNRATNAIASAYAATENMRASLFSNADVISVFDEPFDSNTNSIDDVSNDSATAGSPWPPVFDAYMDACGCPCMVVPCAKGGSSSAEWQVAYDASPFSPNLYNSMIRRIAAVGNKVALIIWWQGETDALNGVSQATFYANTTAIFDAVQGELDAPTKFMVCKLQNTINNEASQQAAQIQLWERDDVLRGPDLSSLSFADGYHPVTDLEVASVHPLWTAAILRAAVPRSEKVFSSPIFRT